MTVGYAGEKKQGRRGQLLRRQPNELRQEQAKRKQAEEELRESRQRLNSIIDASPIPAFVIGIDHKIIYWNKALEELTKIKAQNVFGTSQH